MDVDEFFNMLFDRLENELKLTQQSSLLNLIFGGSIENQLIGKECKHIRFI